MNIQNTTRTSAILLLACISTIFTTSAFATDMAEAKQEGSIGERQDGYLGLVLASAAADVVELVDDINEKRQTQYKRIAATNSLTLEQVQSLAGKKTIKKTSSGNWVHINGAWQQK